MLYKKQICHAHDMYEISQFYVCLQRFHKLDENILFAMRLNLTNTRD